MGTKVNNQVVGPYGETRINKLQWRTPYWFMRKP